MRVISNTAISLDGRIAWNSRRPEMLGSDEDRLRMSVLRSQVDAILIGGNTFRDWPLPMLPLANHIDARLKKSYLNVVLTHDLNVVVPEAFLSHPQTQVLFLAPQQPIPAGFPAETILCDSEITPAWILDQLKQRGVQSLLLEAGGHVLGQFLKAGLLQEMYVTLCPKLIGDPSSPRFLDMSVIQSERPLSLNLVNHDTVGSEIFLHYNVQYLKF